MSIRHSMLALLEQQPMYGAQLRAEFEARTGGTWPLNVGQVYTTLARLERDGLVIGLGEDDEGRNAYQLTDTGRVEIQRWWTSPVDREQTPRNELAIKLALAVTVPGVDVRHVVQIQRTATMRQLRDLTRVKTATGRSAAAGSAVLGSAPAGASDLAWLLVVDNLIFGAEAEIRWLDHVETRVARAAADSRAATPASPVPPATRGPADMGV